MPREANYEAVPRVTYTDPQAGAVGATEAPFSATALVSEVAKTATYTRAYAESNGFLTLLSDGERLTGAYALGPRPVSGSSRPRSPSAPACRSTCYSTRSSPFPTFSEIYLNALKSLHNELITARPPVEAGAP